jgi:branched-chain amino acid transport system substrate-binding protein
MLAPEARMGRLASLFLPIVLALVLVSSCRGRSAPTSGPILIGVVMPQSGGLAADGQAWVRAVRLAADEVNAAGGLLGGRRVELVVEDSATSSNAGVTGAQRVIDEGAVVVIGDGGSDGSLAIYTMVTRMAGVVQISGSATSSSLTMANAALGPDDRYFFRTAPPDGYQAQVVDHITTMTSMPAPHCTNLAVLYQNDAYGMPLATAVTDLFAMHGTVAASVSFTPAAPSYTSEVMMVAASSPDCVVLIAYPADAGLILQEWTSMTGHPHAAFIGTDGLFSDDFLAQLPSAGVADGFFGASPLTTPDTGEFRDFSARYHAAYGHDPENFTASYYDATALALLAIERAGTTDGAMVRDALRAIGGPSGTLVEKATQLRQAIAAMHAAAPQPINYQGASGPITFDMFGDTVAPYEIWRITGTAPPFAFAQVDVVQAADLMTTP